MAVHVSLSMSSICLQNLEKNIHLNFMLSEMASDINVTTNTSHNF